MSYDLTFLPKTDDQSWEEAMAAAEEAEDGDAPSAQVWAELLAAARQELGEVEVFESEDSYELDHEPSGIQLSYYAGEAAISVPYWHRAERARAVVDSIYRLGAAVERLTGLRGFDPQLELPLTEAAARHDLAVETFDRVAASFAERGIESPSHH
ncbi:hypothetical protein [Asanoa siamensis]|uniref:Uncharacterized protein n=1 Tax=Asanoa siamensis TaxID=926357 RepID=A0ABQ4D0Z4_9ACTN|nr:hypothetical protein [Asanoa siamensis]GIF77209.1 hypothetical protein Asi02nite_67270 [Asanoa siamensis]